jgi:uncharacterized protein YecE (DUF72 family)
MYLGARGWQHRGWCGSFYPDDLPQDWELAYYSNEYNAVLVPPALWQQADIATLNSWREEVVDDFRFYLELSAQQCVETAKPAGATGPGETVLSRARILCSEGGGQCVVYDTQIAAMPASLADAAQQYLGDELPVSILRPNETLMTSIHGYYQVYADDRQHIILLSNAQGKKCNLRDLRTLIERIHTDAGKSADVVLFFNGEPPAVDDMQNTRIIAELLGV